MSFCTGCSHFLYQEVHNTKMPDGSYARGPAWVCDSPEALRASQSEDNYDPNIHVRLIGGVCWSCRGEFYTWNGEAEKPVEITRLEQFKAQLVGEKMPLPETAKVSTPKRVKSRAPSAKKKRAEDPSKKRKSSNRSLATLGSG
jgi:Zn-finger nucleic acid-binding protein